MKRNWGEWAMLGAVLLAAMGILGAYAYSFRDLPYGGPPEWTNFADYVSGLLNPVIGAVTVVLVILTLSTTRREAADSRRQMTEQIELLRKQARLADMQKRLDGVLAQWHRLLEQVAPNSFQIILMGGGHGARASTRLVREVVENPGIRQELLESNLRGSHHTQDWSCFKEDLIPLLIELDRYCTDYEREAGSDLLTTYYKARVREGLRTLHLAGLVPRQTFERLRGNS